MDEDKKTPVNPDEVSSDGVNDSGDIPAGEATDENAGDVSDTDDSAV